jgi:hypothetical protein
MAKNLSAGYHPIIAHVDMIGDSNANVTYQQTLQIDTTSPNEGSLAGGLPILMSGNGFAGMNVTVLVCNRSCSSIEIKSNQELICVTPSMSPRITNNHICNVTVMVDGITSLTTFTYRNNLTANITSISPLRGGTGGNTTVTIIGRDFPSGISMGIPTPPLSLFEGQTPSGRPIGKCHSDHSILNFDGLSISSPDSAQVTA